MSKPEYKPVGSMIRVWNEGSDLNGPPDEIRTQGKYEPTAADRKDGASKVLAKEVGHGPHDDRP